MAGSAADRAEECTPIADGCSARRYSCGWSRWGREAHEDSKLHHVTGGPQIVCIEMRRVFRRGIDPAVCRQTSDSTFTRQWTLLAKRLIANALLHVVGFTGKNHQ